MFEALEKQQQWQVEVGLAALIDQLHAARGEADLAERAVRRSRNREAELLEEIRAHRQRLGLPDTPIELSGYSCSDDGAR